MAKIVPCSANYRSNSYLRLQIQFVVVDLYVVILLLMLQCKKLVLWEAGAAGGGGRV